jgi:2-polyprenyl-3-methyl-5-hydroxy-6-metoxy-1,4-benzoquinol methylase
MNEREYRQMYQVEDFHWWYVALHELIASVVAREHSGSEQLHILDAGCGTGRLCRILERFGRVSGCDISDDALECCRERGLTDVFKADLNTAVFPTASYDIITSIDTLYHKAIEDESVILSRFYDALKPGGLLIINLVAHEFLRSTHDIAVHTRKRYTRSEVVSLLEESGFRVEMATYRLGLLFPPIASYRLLRRWLNFRSDAEQIASDVRVPNPLINRFLLGLTRLENRLLLKSSIPFGTSVFAVGRRPFVPPCSRTLPGE